MLQLLGSSENAKGKTVQHKLEMKGSIPPWVLDRVAGVIKDAHPAKFQVCGASPQYTRATCLLLLHLQCMVMVV